MTNFLYIASTLCDPVCRIFPVILNVKKILLFMLCFEISYRNRNCMLKHPEKAIEIAFVKMNLFTIVKNDLACKQNATAICFECLTSVNFLSRIHC